MYKKKKSTARRIKSRGKERKKANRIYVNDIVNFSFKKKRKQFLYLAPSLTKIPKHLCISYAILPFYTQRI